MPAVIDRPHIAFTHPPCATPANPGRGPARHFPDGDFQARALRFRARSSRPCLSRLSRLCALLLPLLAGLAAGAACSRAPREAASLQPVFERLDAFVQRHMQEWNTPGMALALTDRERLLRVAAYGYADLASRAPLTPQHLFEIGSISKSFTAIALLQERERGRFDPHQPIARYLPWFRIRTAYAPMTGHHLLTHTAGIPRDRDDIPPSAPRAQVSALAERQTGYPPGIHYAYSNIGYQILGCALEAVAGKPYAEIVRERIFEPLDMSRSEASLTYAMRSRLAVGHESIYDDRPSHPSHPLVAGDWQEYAAGDGAISTTAADLAAYLRMLLNRGAGPRGRILSEESFDLLIRPAVPTRDGRSYAYGLSVGREDGHTLFGHGGDMIGFSSRILGDLEDGVGAVVLVNGPADPGEVAEFALRLLTAKPHGKDLPDLPSPGSRSRVENAAWYAGTYTAADGRTLVIAAEGQSLALERDGKGIPLLPRGKDAFLVNDPQFSRFLLRFGRDGGEVVELSHGPDWYAGERYRGPRHFSYPEDWTAYPGHYRSAHPWFSNFRIVLRKDRLWLVAPDGDEHALEPLGGGEFRVGNEKYSAERLRLDRIVDGKALRANLSGVDYFRAFTP